MVEKEHIRERKLEKEGCVFSVIFLKHSSVFREKKFSVADLNSLHVNKWATEAAGCPLITTVGAIYANPFPCSPAGQG